MITHEESISDSHKPPPATNRILLFVCLVVFLDAMGIGLVLPVMPKLIEELSGVGNAGAAEIGGLLVFTYAGMQFLGAPILGGLSDRYGRRPVLLLALLGFSIDYFVMAASPTLIFLFVARFLSGVLGATYTAANAAIVDISDNESRAKFFGIAGAASGIGLIFGPAIGGLLGEYGTRLPFIASGVLALLTCVYGYFAFPETLRTESRREFSLRRANPIGSILSVARNRETGPLVIVVLAVLFFIYLANQSYIAIWSYFVIEVANWSPLYIGFSIAVYGLSQAFVQGILTGPVIKRFGEVRAITFSLCIGIITFIGLALASKVPAPGVAIYALILFGALSGFASPSLQALMTKNTPENAQGELQGANSSAFSITSIIGPILMTQFFSNFSDTEGVYLPGAAFLVSAFLVVVAMVTFRLGIHKKMRQNPQPTG